MSEPRVTEVTVNFSGGGRIAVVDFGKVSSNYGASITRRYQIPDDWDADQVAVFELEQVAAIKEQLEPVLQEEFDFRYDRREWEHERGPLAGK